MNHFPNEACTRRNHNRNEERFWMRIKRLKHVHTHSFNTVVLSLFLCNHIHTQSRIDHCNLQHFLIQQFEFRSNQSDQSTPEIEKLNGTRSTVSMFKNGSANPTHQTLFQLLCAFQKMLASIKHSKLFKKIKKRVQNHHT